MNYKCFGGFSISQKAMLKLIEMKSELVKEYTVEEYCGKGREEFSNYEKIKDIEGYKYSTIIPEVLHKNGKVYSEDIRYLYKNRSHPDIIKVVEKLGKEANGEHADLKIVKIPNDVEFEIDDYNGLETIHEKHRSWS